MLCCTPQQHSTSIYGDGQWIATSLLVLVDEYYDEMITNGLHEEPHICTAAHLLLNTPGL